MKPYYEHGGITIYHGDCREILPQFKHPFCVRCGEVLDDPSIMIIHHKAEHEISLPPDLVLTDPPYGIGISSRNLGAGRADGTPSAPKIYGDWDSQRATPRSIYQTLQCAQNQIIWGGNYYADLLPPSQGWLVWDKRGDDIPRRSYADVELAWSSLDRAARMYKCRWDGFIKDSDEPYNHHPTPKPVAVMSWCLTFFPETQKVIDPFCGGGSTLIAAKKNGMQAIGIEIEEKYCEIAAKRLSQEVFQF